MKNTVSLACRHSLLIVLLVLSSASVRAQLADIHQGVLTVPEVVAGETAYRAEFSLLPNTDPIRLELIASSTVDATGSSLAATFNAGILKIPKVHLDEKSYWLEIRDNGNNVFILSNWGLNPSSVPDFDHSAEYLAPTWQRLNGSAYDIGVGANGDVWVIGTDFEPGGFGIYNISGSAGFSVDGGAIRIDVDPDGNPWIVNDEDNIYRWIDGDWQRLPGNALDIGIGADGSVWVVSSEGVYLWDDQGWIDFGGSGSRIDVGPDGRPWVVGFSDQIYTLVDGEWRRLPGSAGDIGVGADGSVWVVAPADLSSDDFDERRNIYRWNGAAWDRISGDAIDISVGADGMPWVTNLFADIYRGR